MRIRSKLILALLVCVVCSINAQTEEQKKKIEEAQRKADSMMNTPQLKALMEQIQQQSAEAEEEKEKRNAAEKKDVKVSETRSNDDFYWRNTIASDTNGKFAEWTGGAADFGIIGHQMKDGTGSYKFFKLGTITAAGNVVYDLPSPIEPKTSLKQNNNLIQGSFLEMNSFKYTNEGTGFIGSFTLNIIRDGKPIGLMTMGNSIKVARNLSAPCCAHKGDEGYRVYLTYAKAACTLNYDKEWSGKVSQGETEATITVNHSYQLNFKSGWNIVKTQSLGTQKVGTETYGKTRVNTIVETLPTDTRYFFQSSPGNPIKIVY